MNRIHRKFKGKWFFPLIFIGVLLGAAPIQADSTQEDVNYLELSKLLVKDGFYSRAEATLQKVSKDQKQEEKAIFTSLWGMIYLQKKQYQKALESFKESLQADKELTELHLYMAEAYLQLKEWALAQRSLDQLKDEERSQLPYFLVQCEILWQQGNQAKAWDLLNQAKKRGLNPRVIMKKKFHYFLQQGLYLSAKDLAFKVLKENSSFQDGLAMASQLRLKKQFQYSLELLQHLQVLRPDKESVALEMAQNYLALQEPFSAALILEKTAKHNSSLSFEASEMLRQVGKSYRARFLNLSTLDPAQRLKQKMALYLEEDDYHSLKYMIPQLQKTKLLEDQDIRYAVAYSLFRTGDFKKSESYLNSIDKDGLFEKSIELKQEISNCQKEKWACYDTI